MLSSAKNAARVARVPALPVIALILACLLPACLSTPGATKTRWVANGTWLLVEIEGTPVLEGITTTLSIENAKRIFGSGGVNRYFGTLERFSRRGFRILTLASTHMAGPADALAQELRYLEILGRVDVFETQGNELILGSGGSDKLSFRRVP